MGRGPLVECRFGDDRNDAVDHRQHDMGTAADRNSGGGRRCIDRSITVWRRGGGWSGFDRKRRGNRSMKTAAAIWSRRGSSREYSGEASTSAPDQSTAPITQSGDSHHFAFYPDAWTNCRRCYRRLPVDGLPVSFFSNPSSSDRR